MVAMAKKTDPDAPAENKPSIQVGSHADPDPAIATDPAAPPRPAVPSTSPGSLPAQPAPEE